MSQLRTSAYWQERSRRSMGTTARLVIGDADDALADWAETELERLERSWSRFLPDSDLAALNASSGDWFEMPPLLAIAMNKAAELWRITEGAFDPTVIGALECAGYDRSFELMARVDDRAAPTSAPVPGFADVVIDAERRAIWLPSDTRIDLGGVGKGLAADLIADGLVDRGARCALVSLGGDMRVAGEAPDGGWNIPVVDPSPEARVLFHHVLNDGAIVQSTSSMRTWTRAGRVMHHIIDPQTGSPAATDVPTVVVAGAEAWLCEGLAKAAIVRGADEGAALLSRFDVDAWFVDEGRVTSIAGRPLECSWR